MSANSGVQAENDLNFSNFLERLNYELDRAKRFRRDVSVCVFSLDDHHIFGAVERRELLKQFAAIIRDVLRTVDLMVAPSSDDLAVILPETNLAGAVIVAERVIKEVGEREFNHNDQKIKLTCSAAAAAYPEHALDASTLAAQTMSALVLSREGGGNRVTSAIK